MHDNRHHTHLLTEEVARRLRVSARTLERWRYKGMGPRYRRLGGRVVYAFEDVFEFEQADIVETRNGRP